MLGCFKLRAVPINVNFRYVEEELRYIFDNADLVAVVYDPEFADRLEAIAASCRSCGHRSPSARATSRAWRRRHPTATSRALRRRPLHPLHGRHHRHAEGRDVAPGGRVHGARPGHRRHHRPQGDDDDELAKKGAASPVPLVMLMIPPLMHGAAQWGMLGQLFQGNTIVLMPAVRRRGGVAIVEREGVNTIMIAGDAMGRPMIEALEAGPTGGTCRRCSRPRRAAVLGAGEGPLLRAVPEPD